MTVHVLAEAQHELNNAVARYSDIDPRLGVRLKQEAHNALVWIANNPELPRIRSRGYRRVNLRTFPYFVAYIIHMDAVFILVFGHGHRRPEYWISRSP